MRLDAPIIDVHSHVLPGLDDGAQNLDEALRMCELYVADGVRTVVATPHVWSGHYDVGSDAIRRGVDELSEACARRGLDLTILPGSEVRVRPELLAALAAGRLMTVGDNGAYLLLELHAQRVPPMGGLLFELGLRGVQPILCHPERHTQIWEHEELLDDLVGRGCLVQVTGASLLGAYGRRVQRCAEHLLAARLVHLVASDAHSPRRRRPLLQRTAGRLIELGGEALARRLLVANPARIVAGQPLGGPVPSPVPATTTPR